MDKDTKIQALADFAVKRGDYRRGSKNYEEYVATLLEMPQEEIDARYDAESAQEAEREKTKSGALNREPKSQSRWSQENSKLIAVRMMTKGDADILDALEGKNVPQEIRRLLRLGIAADQAKE